MSISKRLKAAGHKGPHPLADWKTQKEREDLYRQFDVEKTQPIADVDPLDEPTQCPKCGFVAPAQSFDGLGMEGDDFGCLNCDHVGPMRPASQDARRREAPPRPDDPPAVAGVALSVDSRGQLEVEPIDADGLPVPGAVTPEGAWYRVGRCFYRQGEGPYPKWLHPTGQVGLPWRQQSPRTESPPAPPADVVRGVVVTSRRRGRKPAAGQITFLDTSDYDMLERS